MKKIFILVITSLSFTTLHAQDVTDALRYAQTNLNGTARYRAMGGAFGALGGDLSSINNNPAGSVIFANNQIGLSLTNFNTKNDADYFGTKSSENKNNLNINQAGGVFVFENNYKSDWKKFAFAVNYENAKNLDNTTLSTGVNPINSIDKYFLSYANGVALGTLNNNYFDELYYNEQQAYLGYNSYIIDPNDSTDPNNTTYYTNVSNLGNYYQRNAVDHTGYNGKLSINFSGQYTDKWSFGMNLNSHFSDYRQVSRFYESNTNPKYPTFSTVDVIKFNNDLYTRGSGFSMQFGTIYKPVKSVRLGLAYESPTWYRFTDELTQSVITSGYGLSAAQNPNQYFTDVQTNPNTTIIFQPYKLQTPSKWTGSFAYVFGKKGLLSIDYSTKNYGKTQYRPQNEFPNTNSYMRYQLTRAGELRIGTEYKIKKVSLRAGYRWEESPYKNHFFMGDLTTYSGGLGYNFGTTKLDVSYSHAKNYYNQQFFSQGLTDGSKITANNNNVTLTLLFEL